MKKPFLIIGAGIAGLSIARSLEKRGLDFELIDQGVNHSSKVAAGLINPIVFRRMLLGWRVHDFLPETIAFYKSLEQDTGTNYLHPIPIRRAFAHQQERELWESRQHEEVYRDFLHELQESDLTNASVINTYGTGLVNQSYFVDAKLLLHDLHLNWQKSGNLRLEKFAYDEVNETEGTYQNKAYEALIFCEGYHALDNPWFNYLPLQATKGELLTVHAPELNEKESINRKCFVLPLGNHLFKVGSTYVWNTRDLTCTTEAKDELLGHLAQLTSTPVELRKQQAGIRPTVPDRRPLIGSHPNYPKLKIFNGLGAKGYLLAPLLSKEFIAHLLDNTELDPEVDIKRYTKFLLAAK